VQVPSRTPSFLEGPLRLLLAPAGPITAWLERLAAVQAMERGIGLGAQAFSALIPLVIVYSSVVPVSDAHSFGERIIETLKLSGTAAASVREAIAPPSTVAHSVTVLGIALVVISALSFARALQRLYELSYGLPSVGIRGTHWHLLWIALMPIYISLRPLVAGIAGGWWRIGGSLLLGGVAWLSTPYILLGRRIAWRRLLPGAVIAALSMTALGGVSLVYLPHSVSTSAERFGAIGVAFALLSWLVLACCVLVGAATAGAVVLDRIEHRQ
jgi:membrane protein